MKKLLHMKWPIAAFCVVLVVSIMLPFALNDRAVSAQRGTLADLNIDSGDAITAYGVDISFWQQEVDFDALYQSGADFVILRAGFSTTEDSFFEENYQKAKQAGLDVGAYWFSYALDAEDAALEAEACLQVLSGKTFEYPIFFDYEYEPQSTFAPDKVEAICMAFIDRLTNAGFYTGIYSSVNWLRYIIPESPIQTEHPVWMAMFSNSGTYELYANYCDTYDMWQYSESGTVGGVNGNVDMDICFVDYPAIIREGGWNGFTKEEDLAAIRVEDAILPDLLTRGEEFTLGGSVVSDALELSSVSVCVLDYFGNVLTYDSFEASGYSFDLASLAGTPDFTALKPGDYRLQIIASAVDAEFVICNRPFYVHSPMVAVTDFRFSEHMTDDLPLTMSGTLTSQDGPLSSVLFEIFDFDGYNEIPAVEFTPEAESFDLSAWNSNQTLAPGRYYCLVTAATDSGACIVFYREFVVSGSASVIESGEYDFFAESLTYADLDALSLRYTLSERENGTLAITDEAGLCLTPTGVLSSRSVCTFAQDFSLVSQSFRPLPAPDGGWYLLHCSSGLFLTVAEDGSFALSAAPAVIYLS